LANKRPSSSSIHLHITIILCRTFALIKPEAVEHLGDILNAMRDHELEQQRAKMLLLSKKNAAAFYERHKSEPYFM